MKSINVQKIINTIFGVTLGSIIAFLFFFKSEKIAYVDSAKILTEFKGAQEAKKAYTNKTKNLAIKY